MRPGKPIKQIDYNGRVLIPRAIMDALGYEIGTPVRVIQGENGDIIIRRNQPRCDVCDKPVKEGDFAEVGDKKLCLACCKVAVEALTQEEA